MDGIQQRDIKTLARHAKDHCVSLFMPVHPVGAEGQQDPIRLRNLLRRAEAMLLARGLRSADARELLAPASELISHPTFWTEGGGGGVSIFLAEDVFHCFRLPRPVDEAVFVSARFHVKPLLPFVARGDGFYLLAISQNKVALFMGTHAGLEPLHVPDLPRDMDQALNLDVSITGGQAHSAAAQPLGKQAAVFHGQGGEPDRHKDDLKQYLRMIERAVRGALEAPRPLLVACVDYLFPLYKQVNRYPHLLDQPLAGNADYTCEHELHQQAGPVVQPLQEAKRSSALQRLRDAMGSPLVLDRIREILPAARQGRVGALFVDPRRDCWGGFDASTDYILVHDEPLAGDEELLNLAVIYTLLTNGEVYSVNVEELPGGMFVAALNRY